MLRGRVEPSLVPRMVWVVPIMIQVVPIMVHATKQTIEVPQMTSPREGQLREQRQEVRQMTSPQDKQLREQRHEVKRKHDTRFLKGEDHLHFDGDVYEDWMDTTKSSQHLQQQQQHTQEGLHVIGLHTKKVQTKPSFVEFRLFEL